MRLMPTETEVLAVARQHKLLASLNESVLTNVIRASKVVHFRPNRPVLKTGDPATHVLCLLNGAMRVFYAEDSGSELLVKLFRGPALLCEMEVLTGIAIMPNARTIQDSDILFVPANVFMTLVNSYPDFTRVLVQDLATRLCVASDRQRALAFADVERRFANLLLDYAQLSGVETSDGLRIETALTQDGISRDLAVSRKAVNNILQIMKDAGILDKRNARYVILDMDALVRRSSRGLLVTHQIGSGFDSVVPPAPRPEDLVAPEAGAPSPADEAEA
jgi:CRP-like cAMP-binding protein